VTLFGLKQIKAQPAVGTCCGELVATEFDVLLYDLTSCYVEGAAGAKGK
jgi:hypothetical protein